MLFFYKYWPLLSAVLTGAALLVEVALAPLPLRIPGSVPFLQACLCERVQEQPVWPRMCPCQKTGVGWAAGSAWLWGCALLVPGMLFPWFSPKPMGVFLSGGSLCVEVGSEILLCGHYGPGYPPGLCCLDVSHTVPFASRGRDQAPAHSV